jgi:hypothetical protein
LAAIERHRGPVWASYGERLRLVSGGRTFATDVLVNGADVRYATIIDGATYASGRVAGIRWRRTPAGLVRVVRSDVQGDPLDRWPVSTLPMSAADCELVGETRSVPHRWVLQDAPAGDVMHWLYVDETTGAIVQELTRDGTAQFTTTFDDERDAAGARRPFHWTIAGFGGPAEVFVDALEPRPADPAAIALPVSSPAPAAVDTAGVPLPVQFSHNAILVDVSVNGRRARFMLDTGTTQILVAAGTAKRLGITTVLDHGLAASLDAGALHLRDQPVMTVPDIFGLDGILGYDVFAMGVVHIDFLHHAVELQPRATFQPPADATSLATNFSEGMPLATAVIGALHGNRFALDTGSQELVLTRYLWETRGLDASSIGGTPVAGRMLHTDRYLEGPIVTMLEAAPDLQLGPVRVTTLTARVEKTNSGTTLNIPLDGIIGTDVLALFEWWFDYADGKTWIRVAR